MLSTALIGACSQFVIALLVAAGVLFLERRAIGRKAAFFFISSLTINLGIVCVMPFIISVAEYNFFPRLLAVDRSIREPALAFIFEFIIQAPFCAVASLLLVRLFKKKEDKPA